jgi:hypothetical protein
LSLSLFLINTLPNLIYQSRGKALWLYITPPLPPATTDPKDRDLRHTIP